MKAEAGLLTGALLLLAACGGDGDGSGATTTTVEPVVAEEAAVFAEIRVEAGGRRAVVESPLRERAAPLPTGRSFDPLEPLSSYGLESPRARIAYERRDGSVLTVLVGGTTVDGRFTYVQRVGETRIFLVPTDRLAPLLALVTGAPSAVAP